MQDIINNIIGYVGMAFVVSSFFMTNLKWLRLLNILGGTFCCIYGFLTQTYPTAILNLLLVCINIGMVIRWYIKHKNKKGDKEYESE